MDVVWLNTVIMIICLFLLGFWVYYDNRSLKENAEDIYDALEQMDKSLGVVALVLEKLPEMVPQFQINESPLSKILEFFQTIQQPNAGDTSLTEPALRDDSGRYSDGTKEIKEDPKT